jgi:signal transduction histidine kinase/ligand-binding sensor domain-containing protein/ActR/RegA family two-component response regulator
VEHWGPREGFPEETILALAQTSDGYLWTATPLGLVRFDGRDFVIWDHHQVRGLEALRAASLLAAPDGSLWLRTADGLVWRHYRGRFDRIPGSGNATIQWLGTDESDRIWIVSNDAVQRWIDGTTVQEVFRIDSWRGKVSSYFLDRKNRLWLRLMEGGLVRLSGNGLVEKQWLDGDAAPGVVQSMVEDDHGTIWLATAHGLFHVEQDRIRKVPGTEQVTGSMIRLRLDQDALWIASDNGLSRLYHGRLDRILDAGRMDRSGIAAMFTDREGSLWLGSVRNGLYRLKDSKFANLGAGEGLSSNLVHAVLRDSRGTVWIGTDTGLDTLSGGSTSHFGSAQGVPEGGVRAIAEDGKGRIWLGGDWGLAVQSKTRFRTVALGNYGSNAVVRALAGNARGTIWAASPVGLAEISDSGTRWLKTPPEMPLNSTRQLQDAGDLGLLVSVWHGGLWQCARETCEPVISGVDEGRRVSVYGIFQDSAKVLWVVSSRGLGRLVPAGSGGKLKPDWIDVSARLNYPEREFYQVGEDSQGRLWLAARRSLVRLKRPVGSKLEPESVSQYDLHDGMRSANFGVARQGWRSATRGGMLWFPSMIGLVGVNEDRIRENPLPPPVHIERLLVDGKEISLASQPLLEAGTQRVEIVSAGLSLFDPSKVRYRFKLEGVDGDWVEAGANNRAMYMRLGPGDYIFRVQACNNDGVWNRQGASLSFRIDQYIWERSEFRLLAAAVFFLAGAFALRFRTNALKERNAELERRVRERTAELEAARQQAEEGARAKADFLATMSHEIRTPMNGVLGMVSLLEKTSLTPEQQACTETILASGQGLLAVLNDVLDLSRIEAGRIELHPVPANIRRMCEQVIGLFRQVAREKGLRIVCTCQDGAPEWFCLDEARVRQILVNLVGNAVKFTDNGFVELAATVNPQEDGRWSVTFAVNDSGIGLSPDQVSRLFQKFSQAGSSASRKHGGTGLGLVISKGLAERMAGRLDVESRPGAGSCFRFYVPLETCDAPAAPSVDLHAVPISASRDERPILLAEDNPVNIKVASTMLARLGYTAKVVHNGKEALAALEAGEYRLILMDCQMPEMDGYEATQAIRERYPYSDIVIVAMTANAMAGDRERCLAAGMDDYIAKPILLRDLADCLNRWIGVADERSG